MVDVDATCSIMLANSQTKLVDFVWSWAFVYNFGGQLAFSLHSTNNDNDNDRLTDFDPGQPG